MECGSECDGRVTLKLENPTLYPMAIQEHFLQVFPEGNFTKTLERLCTENDWSFIETPFDEHGCFEEPESEKSFRRSVAWLLTAEERRIRISLENESLQIAVFSLISFDSLEEVGPVDFLRLLRQNCVQGIPKWCVWYRDEHFWFAQVDEADVSEVGEVFISRAVAHLTDFSRMIESGEKTPADTLFKYLL